MYRPFLAVLKLICRQICRHFSSEIFGVFLANLLSRVATQCAAISIFNCIVKERMWRRGRKKWRQQLPISNDYACSNNRLLISDSLSAPHTLPLPLTHSTLLQLSPSACASCCCRIMCAICWRSCCLPLSPSLSLSVCVLMFYKNACCCCCVCVWERGR